MWTVAESVMLDKESPQCGNLGDVALLGIAPAISSIGYSLGSRLALRAKQQAGNGETTGGNRGSGPDC